MLVLYPNIIPQFVDVVIGNCVYELRYRVEKNMDVNNPEPMDMDFGYDGNGGGNNSDPSVDASKNGGSGKQNGKEGRQPNKILGSNVGQGTVNGQVVADPAVKPTERPVLVLPLAEVAQGFMSCKSADPSQATQLHPSLMTNEDMASALQVIEEMVV